ncbi:MAG: Choice-of-anchor protein [Ignavibacteria bacterium]|nr:Choice-of-anchor protein [Ignavibacteria bacterium]
MFKFILNIVLITLVIANVIVYAQIPTLPEKLGPTAAYMLSNSNLGTEFWIAIPQNEKLGGAALVAIEIQVCALKKTEVTLQSGDNFFKTKTVDAFNVVSFSSKNNEASINWEVRESQTNTLKGIHITSKEPIAVFVLYNKTYYTYGYMAIPVIAWGMDYYSCSYYDFYETGFGGTYEGGGGFIVLASESQTKVTINLKEKSGSGKTISGSLGGQTLTTTLNVGELYMVRGDGKKRGLTDFTGSHITATKPIGVISFHNYTMIPSFCSNGQSSIAEMMVPVSALGAKYITVQFDRRKTVDGNGDFFRFVATQPNTTINAKWYDLANMKLLGNLGPKCNLPGDFAEYNQTDLDQQPPVTPNKAQSIVGTSIFESDKPFYCMQYSYSDPWDGAAGWDPDMTLLAPTTQYIPAAIFYVGGLSINDNSIYFIAQGDPGDPQNNLVRSIKIDDIPIQVFDSKALVNSIPETDYYWDRAPIEPGFHKITSNTKLTGFAAGKSNYNAYNWPIIKGTSKLDEPDAEPPVLKTVYSGGVFTITATEIKNTPTQIDQGISKVIFFNDSSYNLSFSMKDFAKFKPHFKVTNQIFTFTVIDLEQPAVGYYAVLDRAGNYIIDSVVFQPEILTLQKSYDLGKTRVGRSIEKTISIVNNGLTTVNIKKVNFFSGTNFKFKENPSLPKSLDSKATFDVIVTYTPKSENVQNPDIDTLYVTSDNVTLKSVLSGKGILPHITVADFNFGQIKVDSIVCIENINQKGLKIDNTGTDTLNILSIDNVTPPFYNNTKTPSIPFAIPPNGTVYFKSICFFPKDTGDYSQDIVIHSDGVGTDSSFKLTGKALLVTGVSEKQPLTDKFISIYPNPALDGMIDIGFIADEFNNVKIEICDISGRTVRTMEINPMDFSNKKISLNISLFESGVYFIKYSSGGSFEVQKLIILK